MGPVPKDFEFSRKDPYRGVGPVLERLIFSKKSLYGCGPVPKDFEFFRKNPYRGVGPVLGTLSFFEKNPYGGAYRDLVQPHAPPKKTLLLKLFLSFLGPNFKIAPKARDHDLQGCRPAPAKY